MTTSPSVRRRVARAASCLCAVGAAAMTTLCITASPARQARAADPPVDAGSVEFRATDDQPLDGGGSATSFVMTPPAGAACPGSGAQNPPYRWQMYLVDSGVDVGAITYQGGPQPITGHTVLKVYEAVSQSVVKDKNPASEPLGQIVGIPTISFGAFAPGDVPEGDYKIGVACTLGGNTVKFWTGGIHVTADPADEPAGFTWEVITLAPPPPANHAPVAVADTANATAGGEAVTIPVLTNDTDADGDTLTVESVTQGAKGTVTLTAGAVTYTANTGPAATDTFSYTVSDGTATATGTVTVTIAAAPGQTTTTTTTTTTVPPSSSTTSTTVSSSSSSTSPATPVSNATTTTARSTVGAGTASLAATGGNIAPIVFWALVMLVFGRMAILWSRPVRIKSPQD